MRRLGAMVKKEVLQLARDKFYLRFLLLAPLMQLIVLGFSLTMETIHVPTLICDLENSSVSRELVRSISTNDRFSITGQVYTYAELEAGIHRWDASLGLYIPPDFSSRMEKEGYGEVQVLMDAVDGNKALTAYGYIQQIFAEEGIRIAGQNGQSAAAGLPLVQHHYLFNPELRNEAFMVPGVVVVILTIITLLIGSMSLVREKETGTLEQLSVTPIRKGELILGKLLPFLIYSFVEVVIILKVAAVIFHLQLAGNVFQLYLAVLLYLFSTLGLGLLVSTIASTQQQALFIAWFFMVFLMLLSGFLISIENMPLWLQRITLLNPLRYMMTVVREIYLKATPVKFMLDQLVPLAILGGGIFGASIFAFRKKVK